MVQNYMFKSEEYDSDEQQVIMNADVKNEAKANAQEDHVNHL